MVDSLRWIGLDPIMQESVPELSQPIAFYRLNPDFENSIKNITEPFFKK